MGKVNSGFVSPMIHVRLISSRIRVISARESPSLRAFGCCSRGNLPARIEMKITLSIPSTISRAVSVKREIHVCGSLSHSIMGRQIAANQHPGQRANDWKTRRSFPGLFPRGAQERERRVIARGRMADVASQRDAASNSRAGDADPRQAGAQPQRDHEDAKRGRAEYNLHGGLRVTTIQPRDD